MDGEAAAAAVALDYVSDRDGGITRRRRGSGFSYHDTDGRPITDVDTLERIRMLAIPPAWTEVWICPTASGHIQATGRDAKGRKQYIYHARWQTLRGETKYDRLIEIARLLPVLRRRIEADLKRPAPSKPRVLATVVRLLETTLIRIGNPEYAKANESYGLTTLRDEHVDVEGARVRFEFKGKSGKAWQLSIADRRMANAVRACQELPGQHLFQYVSGGERYAVTSSDVNAYLREATGAELTAKDIRTWAGTVLMAAALVQADPPQSASHAKRVVSAAVKRVAAQLGNTPTVCRQSYVHPCVFEAYADGRLDAVFRRARDGGGLAAEERAVLALIEACAGRAASPGTRAGATAGAAPAGA